MDFMVIRLNDLLKLSNVDSTLSQGTLFFTCFRRIKITRIKEF